MNNVTRSTRKVVTYGRLVLLKIGENSILLLVSYRVFLTLLTVWLFLILNVQNNVLYITSGLKHRKYIIIKSNQITFIVTSPQHKCLGEWNSYERAPDNNLHMDSTYLQTVQKTMCKKHIHILSTHMALFHCMVRHGTVRYGSLLGGFPLGTVPGTWYFFSTTSVEVPSSRTVTKTWRVNSADHWMAGENRHYCVTEFATRDPALQSYPLDLNQHSQRRIGRNFCLNKRTFLHQPQNSSVVVCWGRTDVPLVDSRGADPVRAWWHDAEGKSLMYNVTFELAILAIFSEYVLCLYFYLCICVLLQLKTIWSNKCTSRLY